MVWKHERPLEELLEDDEVLARARQVLEESQEEGRRAREREECSRRKGRPPPHLSLGNHNLFGGLAWPVAPPNDASTAVTAQELGHYGSSVTQAASQATAPPPIPRTRPES